MTVTVINQHTTATARANWLVGFVIRWFQPSIYPSPNEYPRDARKSKPWGFERTFDVSISRLQFDDLPQDWEHRQHWPPLLLKRNAGKSKRVFIYYHGGGFVNEMMTPQWTMIGQLGRELEADVIVQTYITTPYGGVHDNIDKLCWLYGKIEKTVREQNQELILGGDSAGGCITAAMLLALNDKNLPLPDQAILLAPCLVTDFDTPENRAIEPFDPILRIELYGPSVRAWATGRTEKAKLFRPSDPPTAQEKEMMNHPYAAPLYGDWEFLAREKVPITFSQGTYDLLLPQSDQFVEKAKALDLELTYIRAEKAAHVYPMLAGLPAASFIAPDSVEGLRLIVESVKRYSKFN